MAMCNTLAKDVLHNSTKIYSYDRCRAWFKHIHGIKKPIYCLKFTSTNKDASTYATKKSIYL